MPSLILHVDESLDYIFKNSDVNFVEKNITEIIINELDAEKDNCQIIWVKSKTFSSNYKLYGEIKFREKISRDVNKRERSAMNKNASFLESLLISIAGRMAPRILPKCWRPEL